MDTIVASVLLIALVIWGLFSAARKQKGKGKGALIPTIVEVDCPCGREVNVRLSEPSHTVKCWNCLRSIQVKLYKGYGKVSVWIDGEQQHREHYRIIWQGR